MAETSGASTALKAVAPFAGAFGAVLAVVAGGLDIAAARSASRDRRRARRRLAAFAAEQTRLAVGAVQRQSARTVGSQRAVASASGAEVLGAGQGGGSAAVVQFEGILESIRRRDEIRRQGQNRIQELLRINRRERESQRRETVAQGVQIAAGFFSAIGETG